MSNTGPESRVPRAAPGAGEAGLRPAGADAGEGRAREAQEHAVGRLDDLPPGSHRVVRAGGRELGVFNIRGTVHAIPNLCPHQRGPLCAGGVSGTIDYGPHTGWKLAWIWEDEVVTCPWHSLEFHIPTGRCVAFDDIRLRTYEVRVTEDGELKVVI